jgi:hypothetical protein
VRVIRSFSALLLVIAALVACSPGAGATVVPSPSAVSSPAASAPATDLAITEADSGRTFTVDTGDRLLLMLGTDFDWTVAPTDTAVVARVSNVLVGQGAQGLYAAIGPGTTALRATGDPPCRKVNPPCAAPSILFEVTLTVR